MQVIDTGVGIPDDKQQKIFERFYQMENGHEGSGIGLSLVQRLVELHHGQITLVSEVGKGSTFRFIFLKINRHIVLKSYWEVVENRKNNVFIQRMRMMCMWMIRKS